MLYRLQTLLIAKLILSAAEIKLTLWKFVFVLVLTLFWANFFFSSLPVFFKSCEGGRSAIILPQKRAKVQRWEGGDKNHQYRINLPLKKEKQEARKRRFKPNTMRKKVKTMEENCIEHTLI
jgi:hypothetical protein